MNGLYPIIRRRRVPLMVRDAPPTVAANVEPVKVNAEQTMAALSRDAATQTTGSAEAGTPNKGNAKTTTDQDTQPAVEADAAE